MLILALEANLTDLSSASGEGKGGWNISTALCGGTACLNISCVEACMMMSELCCSGILYVLALRLSFSSEGMTSLRRKVLLVPRLKLAMVG